MTLKKTYIWKVENKILATILDTCVVFVTEREREKGQKGERGKSVIDGEERGRGGSEFRVQSKAESDEEYRFGYVGRGMKMRWLN